MPLHSNLQYSCFSCHISSAKATLKVAKRDTWIWTLRISKKMRSAWTWRRTSLGLPGVIRIATLSSWRIATLVWKKQCTTTALCVLRFACPVCSKFVCDMSKLWGKLDREVSLTPMPEAYQNKMVWILCNDCGVTSEVIIHIVAHKCQSCNSYNTRQTRGGPSASSCRSHLLYSQMFRFMYPSLPLVRLP